MTDDKAPGARAPADAPNIRQPGYDGWRIEKVTATLARVESGEAVVYRHDEAMSALRYRIEARIERNRAEHA